MFCTTGLLLTAGLLAAPAPADKAKAERAKLEGEWETVAHESGDVKVRAGDKGVVSLDGDGATFKGDRVTVVFGRRPSAATYTLDPAASPKRIDLRYPGEDAPRLGVYELDGDTLRLCLAQQRLTPTRRADGTEKLEWRPGPRPAKVDPDLDPVLVFRRVKK